MLIQCRREQDRTWSRYYGGSRVGCEGVVGQEDGESKVRPLVHSVRSPPILSVPQHSHPRQCTYALRAAPRFDAQSHLVLLSGPVPLGALRLCLVVNQILHNRYWGTDTNSKPTISPTDQLQSPCTAKLNSAKQKNFSKGYVLSPVSFFRASSPATHPRNLLSRLVK